MEKHAHDQPSKVLFVNYNQDQGCFACGTETGFTICNTHPFKCAVQRVFEGGISIVEMLFRSNILALVGAGGNVKYPQTKVILWDDNQMKSIGELSFKTSVKAIKLRKDRVVVVLEARIYVYQFTDLKLQDAVDTCPNPKGVCAITSKDTMIMVCPDKKKGHIRIINYDNGNNAEYKAHDGGIAAIALTNDGKLTATASEKGTLVRVFATENGQQLQELRRGSDKAEIHHLNFDKVGSWLACTSDKGTVHIFSVGAGGKSGGDSGAVKEEGKKPKEAKEEGKKAEAKNPTSIFKFLKGFASYFSSQWSFAQFRIPDQRSIVCFGNAPSSEIIVVSYEGNYYLAEFDSKAGGECSKKAERKYMVKDETQQSSLH